MNKEENKKEILNSPILAKAILQKGNMIEIIVVYEGSTRHEFYWVFRARAKRSSRKSWKLAGYYGRDNAPQAYRDFRSFVEYYKDRQIQDTRILSIRIKAKLISGILAKTKHETYISDWSIQDLENATFDRMKKEGKRVGLVNQSRSKIIFPEHLLVKPVLESGS